MIEKNATALPSVNLPVVALEVGVVSIWSQTNTLLCSQYIVHSTTSPTFLIALG